MFYWPWKHLVWMVIHPDDGSMMAPNCFFCHIFSIDKNTAQCCEEKKRKIYQKLHNYDFIMMIENVNFGINLFFNNEIIKISLENVFRIENRISSIIYLNKFNNRKVVLLINQWKFLSLVILYLYPLAQSTLRLILFTGCVIHDMKTQYSEISMKNEDKHFYNFDYLKVKNESFITPRGFSKKSQDRSRICLR